ncbi:MAG: hypothetical protein M3Q68_00815 [Actinomycetota bacterium]|nr:hypothetical protein [Actinomycetota bacterium]
MIDLRTMLHDSAPMPRTPLDMADIQRRARRRQPRRFAAWLGLAGLTLGVGIPGASVLVTAGDPHGEQAKPTATSIDTVLDAVLDADATTDSTTTTTTRGATSEGVRPATAARVDGTTAAAPIAGGTLQGGGATEAPSTTINPARPTTTTGPPPAEAYPRAASCTVDNAGLGPNEQRRCLFTATAAGGASRRPYGDEVNSPHGQVLVTRNGATTAHPVVGVNVFAGDLERGCEDLFIQPGDLVEVILTNSASGTREVETIGAGEHWECYGDQ